MTYKGLKQIIWQYQVRMQKMRNMCAKILMQYVTWARKS